MHLQALLTAVPSLLSQRLLQTCMRRATLYICIQPRPAGGTILGIQPSCNCNKGWLLKIYNLLREQFVALMMGSLHLPHSDPEMLQE
jgi:hypothetical protein